MSKTFRGPDILVSTTCKVVVEANVNEVMLAVDDTFITTAIVVYPPTARLIAAELIRVADEIEGVTP